MASRGINKVILIGNLGGDPEVRYMPSGDAFTTIGIATNESWKDKQTGEQHDKTEWHNVVLFGRLAEIAGEFLRKGSKVYIEGKLQTRKWKDKSGQDRQTTEVLGKELQMLDSRNSGDNTSAESFKKTQRTAETSPGTIESSSTVPAGGEDFDDDIPF